MTDIEKRAHDLAVAYAVESCKRKGYEFKLDATEPFEFGTAYHCAYKEIIKSLQEKDFPQISL